MAHLPPSARDGQLTPGLAAQASTLRMIEESGLRFRLGAMGIEVESRRNDVFALLARCHAAPSTAPGVHRTSTVIKIDDRIGVDWERWSARSAPSSC